MQLCHPHSTYSDILSQIMGTDFFFSITNFLCNKKQTSTFLQIQKVQKINRLKYFVSQLTNSIIHKVEYIYVLAEAFPSNFSTSLLLIYVTQQRCYHLCLLVLLIKHKPPFYSGSPHLESELQHIKL